MWQRTWRERGRAQAKGLSSRLQVNQLIIGSRARMGSRTSHKPADPNQHTTGQNHACSRSMKGCNTISGFFFYFLHSFIWNNCSRRQNICLLCWKYCSRRLHHFLLYRNNYSRRIFFSLCWNNSLASKKYLC